MKGKTLGCGPSDDFAFFIIHNSEFSIDKLI
jgi:hypothetical protein